MAASAGCVPEWKASDVQSLLSSSTETVTIKAGGVDFVVHKALICHFSTYYEAALNGMFMEKEGSLQEIDGLSAESYSMFMLWLYTGSMLHDRRTVPTTAITSKLCDLYIYGDKYDIFALRKVIIEKLQILNQMIGDFYEMQEGPNSAPAGSTPARWDDATFVEHNKINEVFLRLPQSSPLCSFLVEVFAANPKLSMVMAAKMKTEDGSLHPSFATALVERQAEHFGDLMNRSGNYFRPGIAKHRFLEAGPRKRKC